jgi:hypothetical protein
MRENDATLPFRPQPFPGMLKRFLRAASDPHSPRQMVDSKKKNIQCYTTSDGRGFLCLSDPLALFDAAPCYSRWGGHKSLPQCYRMEVQKRQSSRFLLPNCDTLPQTRSSEFDPNASDFSPSIPITPRLADPRVGGKGKRELLPADYIPPQNPKFGTLLRSHFKSFGASRLIRRSSSRTAQTAHACLL